MGFSPKNIRTVYRTDVGGCYAEIEPWSCGNGRPRFSFEFRGDADHMSDFIVTHTEGEISISLDSLEIATLAKLVLSVPSLRKELQEAGLLDSDCKEVSDAS